MSFGYVIAFLIGAVALWTLETLYSSLFAWALKRDSAARSLLERMSRHELRGLSKLIYEEHERREEAENLFKDD